MCKTKKFEAQNYSKPQHKNARPYKKDKVLILILLEDTL